MTAVVVKIGGSLLTHPHFASGLRWWLSRQSRWRQVFLIVGGGEIIDAVRRIDAAQRCDAVAIHWLCVRLMRHTIELVAPWLPEATVLQRPTDWADCLDEARPGCFLVPPDLFYSPDSGDSLPCDWTTTSDSIAALLANKLGTRNLVLLKSCPLPVNADVQRLADLGIVDPTLPRLVDSDWRIECVAWPADGERPGAGVVVAAGNPDERLPTLGSILHREGRGKGADFR